MTIPPITNAQTTPAPTAAQRREPPRAMFSALRIASTGLSAQRVRMDVIAQNVANVETTRTPEGGPYHRRIVRLEAEASITTPPSPATSATAADPAAATAPTAPATPTTTSPDNALGAAPGDDVTGGVRVRSIEVDNTEGPLVYNPGHPDADKSGYVRMPNVNMTDEMMDLMNARRVYEANATVFEVAKAMLHKAIDI
jgi:flagellar basal-body rod protein FlgC